VWKEDSGQRIFQAREALLCAECANNLNRNPRHFWEMGSLNAKSVNAAAA